VRDRQRLPRGQLPLEQRDHAPVAAQHVAEAHGAEVGARVGQRGPPEDDLLGHALGGAHHAGRMHRLVGADQHELLGPEARRHLGHAQRAQDVVPRRLDHVLLHQRHVLVGGRVEDEVGAAAGEDALHPPLVGHVGHHRLDA
jgi:hypothetical protein